MLTWSCSTSLKSRSSRFDAFCAAFCMTVMCGERRRATRLLPRPQPFARST